ncbi:uncharacterized protein LOC124281145 [Haliotis rubra]|uniref:uncharacterized protein LOC124281145 n=1 Tax=Haliotis rubra TaxID=36100 RepID=UPI001EE50BAE|nr:uncharacterized protein LOC124281145 [Haliotis rubra]
MASRIQNFTEEHKLYILQCIEDNISIIEDKRCDANALKNKSTAWGRIKVSFQGRFGINIDTDKLKQLWKRLKLTAKRELRNYEKELKKTGGGPPPKDVSNVSHRIISRIPREFEQLTNPYDDDADDHDEQGDISAEGDKLSPDVQVVNVSKGAPIPSTSTSTSTSTSSECVRDSVGPNVDYCDDDISVSQCHYDKLPILTKRKRQSTGSARDATPETTLLQLAREEHELKLKYMKEEHNLKIEIL